MRFNFVRYGLLAAALLSGVAVIVVAKNVSDNSPPPPDLIFLDRPFSNCSVNQKELTALTPLEKCWIEKLSARCNPADDCLVSCLASTKARDLGGGCWHVCFEVKFPISKWSEPKDSDVCRKLGNVNGIDQHKTTMPDSMRLIKTCGAWRSVFLAFFMASFTCPSVSRQLEPLRCYPVSPEDEVIYKIVAKNLLFDKGISLDSVDYIEATECEGENEVSVIFGPHFQAGVLMITLDKKTLKATLELEG